MNGPTSCRCIDGKTRRTEKPPRSRGRASIRSSTALCRDAMHAGSLAGKVPLSMPQMEHAACPTSMRQPPYRFERGAHLRREEQRLFPRSEVAALVDLVEVREVRVAA